MKKKNKSQQSVRKLQPTIVGSGLLALDVVVSDSSHEKAQYFAGGTCGNVLTILSYLGWHAKPIGRLKDDIPVEWLVEDLSKWGVDCSLVTRTQDGSTPVIIQYIRESHSGERTHTFSLRCPCCGAYLPGYKSILGTAADEYALSLGSRQVFFFDRVSRGTLNLARASAESGALVVFEPSGVGEPRLFREAWSIAHVVKYSNDRLRDIADLDLGESERNGVLLEIETLGARGLRYRSRLEKVPSKAWKTMKVIPAESVIDAAGSGDWCTAGIIHKLSRGGLTGFRKVTSDRLVDALRYGQALATWNCGFEGARGGMYNLTKAQFERQIRSLLMGKSIHRPTIDPQIAPGDIIRLCPSCESTNSSRMRPTAG